MATEDLEQYKQLVTEVTALDHAVRQIDAPNSSSEAVRKYQELDALLNHILETCPHWHRDYNMLVHYREQVNQRQKYLQTWIAGGSTYMEPCERQLDPLNLTATREQGLAGVQILCLVASVGATVGLALLGPRSALAMAAGAAHIAIREDSAGFVTRRASQRALC